MKNKRIIVIRDVLRRDGEDYIEGFTSNHMIAYVLAQSFYNAGLDTNIMTLNTMCEVAKVSQSRQKSKIKDALIDLVEWGLINVDISVNDIGNNKVMMITVPDITSQNRFTTLNAEFCMNIITSDTRMDAKGNTMLTYALLAHYMGGKDTCFPSLIRLESDLGLSKPTILQSLAELKSLNIIDCASNKTRKNSKGQLINDNNVYVFCDVRNYEFVLDEELRKQKSISSSTEVKVRHEKRA